MATAFDPISQAADNLTYWAYQAGFRGDALTRMVAYGLAESGGNPVAHNYNPATGDDSYGLWQINYYGPLAADRTKSLGPASSMLDPQTNANAAYKLSNGGTNFSPWKADDNNGRYAKNLPYALRSVSGLGGNAPGTPPTLPVPGYQTQQASDSTNKCLLSLPSVGPLGGGCLLHESQGRAILGALILASGVVVTGLGVILFMGKSVSGVTKFVPGPIGAVGSVMDRMNERGRVSYSPYKFGEADPAKRAALRRQARGGPGSSVSADELPFE